MNEPITLKCVRSEDGTEVVITITATDGIPLRVCDVAEVLSALMEDVMADASEATDAQH